MKKITVKRFLMILFSCLLIFYVACNVYISNFRKVNSETVVYSKVYDSYSTIGYIAKDERLITTTSTDSLYYVAQNGDTVAKGEAVAYEFQNADDVAKKEKITKLQNEIEKLENLSKEGITSATNIDNINKQIKEYLNEYKYLASNNDLSKIDETLSNILYGLNKKSLFIGNTKDFNKNLSKAKKTLKNLKEGFSDSTKKIVSNEAGYFLGYVDGYENKINYDNILESDFSDIQGKMSEKNNIDENVIGKTISSLNWYVVCQIPIEYIAKCELQKSMLVNFPSVSDDNIKATVVSTNRNDDETTATLVLRCNVMSEELLTLRQENVNLKFDCFEGLKVPKSAVHILDVTEKEKDENGVESEVQKSVQGVYVIYGNHLKFKRIYPIYADNDYLICDTEVDESDKTVTETIGLYDAVIVKGDNLYDGKVI